MINNAVVLVLIVNVLGFIFLWKRNQNLLYAIFSVSLSALLVLTVVKEFSPEWRGYQESFVRLQMERETDPEIIKTLKSTPIKIKQIWNDELGIADRCTTCHMAVDNPAFKNDPEPFRFHAAVREHDFNKIGCTTCHRGQGRATDVEHAHAIDIHHWDYPMWKGDMVQVSCTQCHEELYDQGYNLKGAELIAMARDLTVDNEMGIECVVCHTIRGVGETMAPDLTEYGAATEHEFEQTHDMEHVKGKKDKYNWTYQHFLDPEAITPGNPEKDIEPTVMPNFEFTNEQAHALAAFSFSMKPSSIPAKYLYREPSEREKEIMSRPEFIADFEESYGDIDILSPGQQLFIRSKCWFCHTIGGKGGKVGPDLTTIGERKTKAELQKFFMTLPKRARKDHPMAKRFNFSEEQIDRITDYLVTSK